ncbi:MAG: hypothetical protein FJ271_01160 [Planctomycetes bacterium]|nr:hypothetical protein [Planctomycetota bacterium]
MRMASLTLLTVVSLLLAHGQANAEVVRYRYAPDACGNLQLVPGPNGAPGERSGWLGGTPAPFPRQVIATHVVSFRHSYSRQNVQVPITFPDAAVRMETVADYVQFTFTSYTIRVIFQPNGSVDVVYNSGWLRPIAFQ